MRPDYSVNDPKGWCGDPKRGAAMGRSSVLEQPYHFEGKVYLRKVRLDSGGYDSNGTYFGHGDPLYWCANEDNTIDFMVRGRTRAEAKFNVYEYYPLARFFR